MITKDKKLIWKIASDEQTIQIQDEFDTGLVISAESKNNLLAALTLQHYSYYTITDIGLYLNQGKARDLIVEAANDYLDYGLQVIGDDILPFWISLGIGDDITRPAYLKSKTTRTPLTLAPGDELDLSLYLSWPPYKDAESLTLDIDFIYREITS